MRRGKFGMGAFTLTVALAACGSSSSTPPVTASSGAHPPGTYPTRTISEKQANAEDRCAANVRCYPTLPKGEAVVICGPTLRSNGSCDFARRLRAAIGNGSPRLVTVHFADGKTNQQTCTRLGAFLHCQGSSPVWVDLKR